MYFLVQKMSKVQLSSQFTSPISAILSQSRNYRKHNWQFGDEDAGRSVKVTGNPNRAYANLRNIVNESRLRATARAQMRFESKPDKRRRKRKDKDWATYMAGVKSNVKKAFELKNRTESEKKNYKQLE
jgi:hypothetical protein